MLSLFNEGLLRPCSTLGSAGQECRVKTGGSWLPGAHTERSGSNFSKHLNHLEGWGRSLGIGVSSKVPSDADAASQGTAPGEPLFPGRRKVNSSKQISRLAGSEL